MIGFKPIAMRCNSEQFNAIRPKLEKAGMSVVNVTSFQAFPYLANNRSGVPRHVSNICSSAKFRSERTVFGTWDENTFLEYCGIPVKEKPSQMKKDITIPATEILRIHAVACPDWKKTLKGYLERIDDGGNIGLKREEVDAMFRAATSSQEPLLEEIFEGKLHSFEEGDLVWAWDENSERLVLGIYKEYDSTDNYPYLVGGDWWEFAAPYNNGELPEGWSDPKSWVS